MNIRSYDNSSREAAAEATRRAILQAAFALSGERVSAEIVLADVAERAGTTVKTVLRHFGTRDALFDAVVEFATAEIGEEREAPVGDLDAAVSIVHAHYERRSPWVLRMLEQEHSDERFGTIIRLGRQVHRDWVERTFETVDAELVDLLVVATDIYTWKILRLDLGLTPDATAHRVRTLVRAVLNGR